MRKHSRHFWVFLLAVLSMLLIYAFAAQNTVDSSYAGDGTGSVDGYFVKDITYTLDTADPSKIASVQFTLYQDVAGTTLATATEVYAGLSDGGGTWTWSNQCTGGPSTWTCNFPGGVPVGPVTQLRVVAAQ